MSVLENLGCDDGCDDADSSVPPSSTSASSSQPHTSTSAPPSPPSKPASAGLAKGDDKPPLSSSSSPSPTTATTTPTRPKSSPTPPDVHSGGEYVPWSLFFLFYSLCLHSGTFFYQKGNAGACGTVHKDSDLICAIGECSLKRPTQ
jgi:hypothetical protein